MADLKRSCSHIRHRQQLTKENLTLIFRAYFENKDLKVEPIIKDDNEGVGIHYQSDITRLTVRLSNHEEQPEIKLIIKEPLQSWFQKLATKVNKPFFHEAFWYTEAIFELSKSFPEMAEISPRCFHATSAYSDYGEIKRRSMICSFILDKPDKGLMVMEDAKDPNKPGGPLMSLNPSKIPDVETAKLVMKSLATFHGAWMVWMNQKKPSSIGGLTKERILEVLAMPLWKTRDLKVHMSILKPLEKQMTIIGKSPELIAAFRKLRKSDIAKFCNEHVHPDLNQTALNTIGHGDCWTNNFFVNADHTKLSFIDFQGMNYNHVGRDVWYYIYCSTDSNWRKSHLDETLKSYFDHLKPYLDKAQVFITFQEYLEEMKKTRPWGLVIGNILVLQYMLSPYPDMVNFKTWKIFKEYMKWRDEIYSKPIKDDEHEMIKEINRRMIDAIEEAFTIGMI